MSNFKTEQEHFWAEEFGNSYINRNMDNADNIANRVGFWANILHHVDSPLHSALELGANVGINLDALHILQPSASLTGLEINQKAASVLKSKPFVNVINESILNFTPTQTWDLVFTSGVLIHINPEYLPNVYSLMAKSSQKYICIAEYYNPSPVEIPYRGHSEKLFKRDFAGEFLRNNPQFQLKKYGFVYHNDPLFPADDITWFLMERVK